MRKSLEKIVQNLANRLSLALAGTALCLSPMIQSEVYAHQPSNPPQLQLRNLCTQKTLTIYYLTNSWALYDNDQQDLRAFFREHRNASSFIVEGYADSRGDLEDNIRLGKNRAEGAAEFLKQLGYTMPIQTVSYGEAKPVDPNETKQAYQKNRRVVIVAGEPTQETPAQLMIKRGLAQSPADVYLIDATGSMNEGGKWKTVTSARYKKGSQLYGFNACTPGEPLKYVTSLSTLSPSCETPLWDATGKLLTQMKNGQTLTVLTDGDDNASRTYSPSALMSLAQQKEIKVSIIGIGVDRNAKELTQLATKTGGNFYINN